MELFHRIFDLEAALPSLVGKTEGHGKYGHYRNNHQQLDQCDTPVIPHFFLIWTNVSTGGGGTIAEGGLVGGNPGMGGVLRPNL